MAKKKIQSLKPIPYIISIGKNHIDIGKRSDVKWKDVIKALKRNLPEY